ncbi:MAG: NUDIX hydrolase, partial [Endomicrobiales bacterium]|nr:NUDIX hydrolase [Endomicrobiales bacterium]
MKKRKKTIAQAGVIPFTIKNNRLRLLIITNSRRNKWLFPKGLVENNMTKEESAIMEAFEEAGVVGEIVSRKIGSYEILKYGSICKVDMYPLLVEKVLLNWPEDKIRKRKWISPDEIGEYINDK